MKKRWFYLSMLSLAGQVSCDAQPKVFVSGCGYGAVEPAALSPTQVEPGSTWVIMGSSTAAGAGASARKNSWAGKLAADLKQLGRSELINIAKGGHTTYQGLSQTCQVDASRLQPEAEHNLDKALALKPNVTLLFYPSNDAAVGYSAAESIANLTYMAQKLRQQGSAVVVMSAQPREMAQWKHTELKQFHQKAKQLFGACYVDLYDALAMEGDKLNSDFDHDGVHVNDLGHQVIYQQLRTVLDSKSCIVLKGL